jgi:hypothetical protein
LAEVETGNISDPTSGVQGRLADGRLGHGQQAGHDRRSGMRRIDDRSRHLRRDVGPLSRIDDAKTFKAAKKKIMSRQGDSVAMASGLRTPPIVVRNCRNSAPTRNLPRAVRRGYHNSRSDMRLKRARLDRG